MRACEARVQCDRTAAALDGLGELPLRLERDGEVAVSFRQPGVFLQCPAKGIRRGAESIRLKKQRSQSVLETRVNGRDCNCAGNQLERGLGLTDLIGEHCQLMERLNTSRVQFQRARVKRRSLRQISAQMELATGSE
jgi:hypothetical protein